MARLAVICWATAVCFIVIIQTAHSDRIGYPLDRDKCLNDITQGVANGSFSPTEVSNFSPVGNFSNPIVSVSVCERFCGSEHEVKQDCVNRVKEWMWPVIILIVAMEPTAMFTAGLSALALYFFALGDPFGMFQTILTRIRNEKLCREAAKNIRKEIQAERARIAAERPEAREEPEQPVSRPHCVEVEVMKVKLSGPTIIARPVAEDMGTMLPRKKQSARFLQKSYAAVLSAMLDSQEP